MASKLEGTYQRAKSHLLNKFGNHILTIGHRKNTTPQKPPLYLLYKTPKGEPDKYISSLYEMPGEGKETGKYTYSMDFKGVKYVMTISDTEANIRAMQGGGSQKSL